MFKRMLCLLIAGLMLIPLLPAMADESSTEILTLEELRQWVNDYKIRAMASQPITDHSEGPIETEDGFMFQYDFATMFMDIPEMSADSVVRAMVITSPEEEGLRGVKVYDQAQTVLDAYYSENPDLVGNHDEALLYAIDWLPEGGYVGTLKRDGQRIQVIDYAVYEQAASGGDGYTEAGIVYTIEDNNVIAIRAYGLNERIPMEEASEALKYAQNLGKQATYSRVEISYDGSSLEPFGSEDMIFAGIDFSALTAEDAVEASALGELQDDVWVDDDDGRIRIMQFAACSLTFRYDSNEQNGHIVNMTIDTDLIEGPRSVRVGDTFASVLNRYRNGEGEIGETEEMLYGTEESGTYGRMEYGVNGSFSLRYGAVTEDGEQIVMFLSFDQQYLSEILLMVNE